MTLKEIYKNALALIAESIAPGDNDDYEERAPYILATLCSQLKGIDAVARAMLGEQAGEDFNEIFLPLTDAFPLLARFAAPAALYLASMLILDDDQDMADKLFERYSDSISTACDSVSAVKEKTSNKYFKD